MSRKELKSELHEIGAILYFIAGVLAQKMLGMFWLAFIMYVLAAISFLGGLYYYEMDSRERKINS